MTRLNQIVAVDKGVKSRTERVVTDVHKICQKPALFNGSDKTYHPKTEDGDTFPAENVVVQQDANNLIATAGKAWRELFDVVATKDYGNTQALADVKVDDMVLIAAAPVTFLLFLEKQLNDIRKFVGMLPTLDPSVKWSRDGTALYTAPKRETIKTKKVPQSLVLHEGDENHAPQCQVVAEDIIIGLWEEIKVSSALPEARKVELIERVEMLRNAVKMAREDANNTEVETRKIGQPVLDWLFR